MTVGTRPLSSGTVHSKAEPWRAPRIFNIILNLNAENIASARVANCKYRILNCEACRKSAPEQAF